jgi:threonine dehydratase
VSPPARDTWTPSLDELHAIRRGSAELVRTTPVLSSRSLGERCGGVVALKAENLQRTGSFKLRGALSKLRGLTVTGCRGVVAGSAGNHAQSLAYAARARGIPCIVFMPEAAAISKVEAVEAFGASVRRCGTSVDECVEQARQLAERRHFLFVHPFDDLEIVKGQAGLGLELLEQVPDLARVIVPVGGGGLASGIAAAIKLERPEVRVIGVQAAACAPFPESLEAGMPTPFRATQTIADGIAIKRPGDLTLKLLQRWLDDLVVVDEAAIAEAMVLLLERGKLVTEGAGAAGVAALLAGVVDADTAATTVAVLSGGTSTRVCSLRWSTGKRPRRDAALAYSRGFPTGPGAWPACSEWLATRAGTCSTSCTSATAWCSGSTRPGSSSSSRRAVRAMPSNSFSV